MPLNQEFAIFLSSEITNHHNDLLILREHLIEFKNKGMDKDTMLESLEKIKSISGSKTEDILLELMDFVSGYCNPDLSIFE